jgi:hypothetical protein
VIIVRIHGGLGNQMFQYATGRAIALRTGAKLKFETGLYNPSHLGRYDLDRFEIVGEVLPAFLSARLLRPLASIAGSPGTPRVPYANALHGIHRLYVQRSFDFDPQVLSLRPPTYLIGYWQSERYFADALDVLRKDFAVKGVPSTANRRVLDAIEASNSVCVHVRRTDFVSDAHTAAVHGARGVDYYRAAHRLISEHVTSAHYFVFSDDIAWARENLAFLGAVTFVDNNSPEERHEDMRLMRCCKHFIVANSSFSWWPAWLASNPGKVVVAPRSWFSLQRDSSDAVIPEMWLRA